jgi:NAD(P)-dependent dehydrogenase (short-subunit alcohol dehydrogenase family)
MAKLAGKVAVVTGGTSGIGLATAKLFVREGAFVFITGRRQKELDEAVKEIGDNITGVQGDVSKPADLDRLYETVKTKGRIDVVFANAGVIDFASVEKVTEEHFDKIFNINVRGTLFTMQKALPLMNDGGTISLTGWSRAQRALLAAVCMALARPQFGTWYERGLWNLSTGVSARTSLAQVQSTHPPWPVRHQRQCCKL